MRKIKHKLDAIYRGKQTCNATLRWLLVIGRNPFSVKFVTTPKFGFFFVVILKVGLSSWGQSSIPSVYLLSVEVFSQVANKIHILNWGVIFIFLHNCSDDLVSLGGCSGVYLSQLVNASWCECIEVRYWALRYIIKLLQKKRENMLEQCVMRGSLNIFKSLFSKH